MIFRIIIDTIISIASVSKEIRTTIFPITSYSSYLDKLALTWLIFNEAGPYLYYFDKSTISWLVSICVDLD